MRCLRLFLYVVFFAVLTSACTAFNRPAENEIGGGWYTVKPSDTLYSIAWRYALDYNELAKWNQIENSSIIQPGQRLLLIKPEKIPVKPGSTPLDSTPVNTTQIVKSEPGIIDNAGTVALPLTDSKSPVGWLWPTQGVVLNSFSAAELDRRGIDIAGRLGQPVIATSGGKVVYSGNGLAGYGNLIIIKHSDTYLSAYAYCQTRLVTEGMFVKAGAAIAKMGQYNGESPRLHFEIRKNGKPVDPLKYLAK
mgnify:CR=1 FL=1